MEEMHTKMSEDFEYIQASLNTEYYDDNTFKDKDPFIKSWDQLKDLAGIDANFKRRTTRNISKYVPPADAYSPRYPAVEPTPRYLENALINATLRNTSYTSPTTVYLALYTDDPTDADTGTEISGGSYARQSITFGAPSNGTSTNSAAIEFPAATANWGVITHVGIRDALTSGNLLYHTALDASKTINNGDIFKILTSNLSVTLA